VVSNVFTDSNAIDRVDDSLQTSGLSTWQVVSRLMRDHLLPRKKLLAGCFAAMALSAAATGSLPFLMQQAADEVFLGKNETMLYVLPVLVVVLVGLKATSEYFSTVGQAYVGNRIVADLRVEMFERLTQADLGWLQRTHSGRFISSFMNDVLAIREAAGLTIVALGQNILKVAMLMGAMFYMDWRLSIFAVIAIPLVLRVLGRQRQRVHISATKTFQETGDLSSLVSQTLTGIRVVKAFAREPYEFRKFDKDNDHWFALRERLIKVWGNNWPFFTFLIALSIFLLLWFGGPLALEGTITVGALFAMISYVLMLNGPVQRLGFLVNLTATADASASRVFEIMDTPNDIEEQPDARMLDRHRGQVTFDRVSFGYRDGLNVLHDISFSVQPGQTVALMGPTGSGKSSVINLIPRFYDPVDGRVLVDGMDVREVTLDSLRASIGIVLQEPFLFSATIGQNIAYGRPEASRAEVEAAARALQRLDLDGFAGRPLGSLSGGELQRAVLARALAQEAPILLLDEPTTALDLGRQQLVLELVDALRGDGLTVVTTMHDLTLAGQYAERLVLLDHGAVVAEGAAAEVLSAPNVAAHYGASVRIVEDETGGVFVLPVRDR